MSRVVKFKIKRRKGLKDYDIQRLNETIQRLRKETFDGALILGLRHEENGIRFFTVFCGLTRNELIGLLSWFILKYPDVYNASIMNIMLKGIDIMDKGDINGSVV